MTIVKKTENSEMLYLRRLLYCAVRKIYAEIKASDIKGDKKMSLWRSSRICR